jgi:hypothetical protein
MADSACEGVEAYLWEPQYCPDACKPFVQQPRHPLFPFHPMHALPHSTLYWTGQPLPVWRDEPWFFMAAAAAVAAVAVIPVINHTLVHPPQGAKKISTCHEVD